MTYPDSLLSTLLVNIDNVDCLLHIAEDEIHVSIVCLYIPFKSHSTTTSSSPRRKPEMNISINRNKTNMSVGRGG